MRQSSARGHRSIAFPPRSYAPCCRRSPRVSHRCGPICCSRPKPTSFHPDREDASLAAVLPYLQVRIGTIAGHENGAAFHAAALEDTLRRLACVLDERFLEVPGAPVTRVLRAFAADQLRAPLEAHGEAERQVGRDRPPPLIAPSPPLLTLCRRARSRAAAGTTRRPLPAINDRNGSCGASPGPNRQADHMFIARDGRHRHNLSGSTSKPWGQRCRNRPASTLPGNSASGYFRRKGRTGSFAATIHSKNRRRATTRSLSNRSNRPRKSSTVPSQRSSFQGSRRVWWRDLRRAPQVRARAAERSVSRARERRIRYEVDDGAGLRRVCERAAHAPGRGPPPAARGDTPGLIWAPAALCGARWSCARNGPTEDPMPP